MSLHVSDVKPFIPAKNFQVYLNYYKELGFATKFERDDIAELEIGDYRFFLQNYYVKAWANNSMLFINVSDAFAWYEHISKVVDNMVFKPARVKPPEEQNYGDLVTFAWDPAGVLLHFAENQ